MALSRSQLDKLGERLKAGDVGIEDLRLLDEYRRSFAKAGDAVVQILRSEFGLLPTARPAKSTTAIVEKLLRQGTRLSQMQDIAGCRAIVVDLARQEQLTRLLRVRFPDALIFDRIGRPSSGYRAVHFVVKEQERWVEIQVRTELQHLWAMLSEKAADKFGHGLKYGAGPSGLQAKLVQLSENVYDLEFIVYAVSARVDVAEHPAEDADLIRSWRILRANLQSFAESPDSLLNDS